MKVIVAGYPKTGTKSMQAALSLLGYKVYDVMENMVLFQDEYIEILNKGWSTEEFRQMYENVDAVTDMPACFFWDEIHKAFPDAKIILTLRDNEDVWWNSMGNQLKATQRMPVRILEFFSPTAWRARKEILNIFLLPMLLGVQVHFPYAWNMTVNEQLAKKLYRSHNAYVMQAAPKDKLLMYKCSDGWEPLCRFLGVPVPDCPFPRKNVRGNVFNELNDNPVFQRLQREVKVSLVKYCVVFGAAAFCSYKYGPINCLQAIYDHTRRVLGMLWS